MMMEREGELLRSFCVLCYCLGRGEMDCVILV